MQFRTDELTIGQRLEIARETTSWREITSFEDFGAFLNAPSTITVIAHDPSSALHKNMIVVLRQHNVPTRVGLVRHKMLQLLGMQAAVKEFVMVQVQGGSRRLVRVYNGGEFPSKAVAWLTESRPRSEPLEVF